MPFMLRRLAAVIIVVAALGVGAAPALAGAKTPAPHSFGVPGALAATIARVTPYVRERISLDTSQDSITLLEQNIKACSDRVSEEARFRSLFDAHHRAIARYFLARGHRAGDVDDLVASTFEVAWRQLDSVPADDEAVPWLLTVARNHSRNAWRKTQRESGVHRRADNHGVGL